MKISLSLVLLCLLLFVQRMEAQSLHFLDNSQWFLTEVNPLSSTFDWYQTGKDSSINGRTYYQALKDYDPLPIWLREEPDSQRVYVNAAWNGWSERLLYDFSLQAGDTVALSFRDGGPMRFVVDNIDAVNSTQGFIPRLNLLNLDGSQPAELEWTPGVGAFSSPFYLDLPNNSDTTFMLICNYQNGMKLWDNGFGTCPGVPPPLAAGEEREGALPKVGLQQGGFSVEFPAGKSWGLEVWDLNGRRIWMREVRGGMRIAGGEGWERGLYLLRMRSGSRVYDKKWLGGS